MIAHENAHIRRKDHWWKAAGYVLLAIYWFNPLIWLAYILLCRDIEAACDEKTIKAMNECERREYASTLLKYSVSRRMIITCPPAFGEIRVKERIKRIMDHKKPSVWLIVLAMVCCTAAVVCFLTDPPENSSADTGLSSSRHWRKWPYRAEGWRAPAAAISGKASYIRSATASKPMCILTITIQPMVFHLEKLLRRQQDLTDLTLCSFSISSMTGRPFLSRKKIRTVLPIPVNTDI